MQYPVISLTVIPDLRKEYHQFLALFSLMWTLHEKINALLLLYFQTENNIFIITIQNCPSLNQTAQI